MNVKIQLIVEKNLMILILSMKIILRNEDKISQENELNKINI